MKTACLLFLSAASVASAQKTPRLPEGVFAERDVVYGETEDGPLTLDVYKPTAVSESLPVVVFVHGGGWKGGDKRAAVNNAVWLVPEGYAVVSINYRLTDVARWPAQIEDCYAAVRWVRANAERHGFRADRVAAWGTSAGGHLAGLMGTRPDPDAAKHERDSRVQAVVDWFGPSDLLTMPPNVVSETRTKEQVAASNGAKLLGSPVPDVPELAKDASPLHHVSADDPPFLVMHGSADPGVPLTQSKRLHEALKAARVDSTLKVLDGAGHGGKAFQTDEARTAVREFLKSTVGRP